MRAAAAAALEANQLGYSVALGIPELRAAIAGSYADAHGLVVDPDDVVVTTGSSGGFLLTFLACFDVGDRVAVAQSRLPVLPQYPRRRWAARSSTSRAGPRPDSSPPSRCWPTLDPPLHGVIVASPANPTGTVIPPDELAAIASWCAEHGCAADQRRGLPRPGVSRRAADQLRVETSRDAVVVNSFSKYFAMTGWRLGWLLVPKSLQRAVDRLTGNFTICPPVLSQIAAVAAFTPESVAEADGHLHHYGANRDRVAERVTRHRNRQVGAHRRRVLRLCRRVRSHRRLAGVLLKAAGRYGRGDRTGHRLRHGPRRIVRAAFVRRADLRHRRGDQAYRRLAQVISKPGAARAGLTTNR